MQRLRAWWEALTAPHASLAAGDKRQSELLSSLLLFVLVAGILLQTLTILLAPAEQQRALAMAGVTTAILVLALYLLSRTPHQRLAATLSVLVLTVVILAGATRELEPAILYYLIIPVLLSSYFVSLHMSVALMVLSVAAASIPFFLLAETTLPFLYSVRFYVIGSGLLLLAADHRRRTHADQQARLRDSESLYRTLFESTPLGLGIADEQGKLVAVNDAFLEAGGYTQEEVLALASVDALICDSEEREQVGALVRERGEIGQRAVRLRGHDGAGYDALLSLVPVTLHGEPGWLAVVQDVTDRMRAEAAEQEQRALAEALRDIAAVLNSTLDLDQVLARILDNVGRVVPHDGANVMLIRDNVAHVVGCQGYYQEEGILDAVLGLRFPVEETPNFQGMATLGQPCLIADTAENPDWTPIEEAAWVRSYVGAPIMRAGEVIGFLNLDSATPGFFTESHGERLQAFADQVAIALRNARLYQELEAHSAGLKLAVAERTAKLRRTTEEVEVILNNSPDATLLLRPDGTVKRANPAFYHMFGFGKEETPELALHELILPAPAGLFRRALSALLDEGKWRRLECTVRRQDGSTFDADVALAPVMEEGRVLGGVCSLRDISRLKEVDRMKDAFVSNVSHELRTPITSLRLYHDLLRQNPPRSDVYLQRLGREISRLNTIIEDLLRLSRLDRGRVEMTLEAVDMNDLAGQYVDDRQPLAREKDLTLTWEPHPAMAMVQGDRGMLEQALGILLTNALNYTPAGGDVTVALGTQRRRGRAWVVCSICDSGPGIEPREQAKLFERFYRGKVARESGTPGTGLGLAIAREIAERHEGFIEVESEGLNQGGSTFTLWLPAQE